MIDVVVAGGGPAGLAAAITAASAGARALVIEPHEGVIDKACGEGIMPGGLVTLRALGVDPGDLDGRPFIGVRYVSGGLSATGNFAAGPGLGVRRTVLHAALRQRAADLGVVWKRGRVTTFEARQGVVDVEGTRAGWLVGADGLHSTVRRALGLGLPPRRPPRFGVRRHVRAAPWTYRVEVHLAPGVEAYVTPVSDAVVGVAFLTRPPARWEDLLARFPALAARLGPPVTRAEGAGPFEQRVAARTSGRVLLAGDAAGYVDPLTGEGVSVGMRTAVAAVRSAFEGADYEDAYRRITRRYVALTKLLVSAVDVGPHAVVRLARAVPSAFDRVLTLLDQRAPPSGAMT